MISIRNLTKKFGDAVVLDNISMEMVPGKVYGLVGLDSESKKHVGKYSLGMRQRLGLAQALMENPNILLLDEPLSGLDNDGVLEMHGLLMRQKEQGRLLVIASHSKEDIAVLCDEVFRFDKGKMIAHEVLNKENE